MNTFSNNQNPEERENDHLDDSQIKKQIQSLKQIVERMEVFNDSRSPVMPSLDRADFFEVVKDILG